MWFSLASSSNSQILPIPYCVLTHRTLYWCEWGVMFRRCCCSLFPRLV